MPTSPRTDLPRVGASFELVHPICREGRSTRVALHAARVLQQCCDDRCVAHGIDAAGAVGRPLPWGLGLSDVAMEDVVQVFEGAWPTEAWLAVRRTRPGAPPRVAVVEHAQGRWTTRYATRADSWNVSETVLGIGRWPGGAVLAAVHAGSAMFPSGQRIEVVRGRPGMPVPALPDPETVRLHGFVALESGHAFATASAGHRLALLRWEPGVPQPSIEVRPELEPGGVVPGGETMGSHAMRPGSALAVRSPREVHALGIERGPRSTTVNVLRFDGERWATVARLPGAEATALVTTPDGALWAVTTGPDGGLWRRAPGSGDRWSRVVVAGTALQVVEGTGLLPAGRGDVLLVGDVAGTGPALVRVRVTDPR